jgi:hypothetical protein
MLAELLVEAAVTGVLPDVYYVGIACLYNFHIKVSVYIFY